MNAKSRQNRRRPYRKTGVYTLKRAVQVLGSRAMPSPHTALGRALREWRESLVADLGGPDSVTTQQLALVDTAVRSKLLVDSVDAYVLGMPSPIIDPCVSNRNLRAQNTHYFLVFSRLLFPLLMRGAIVTLKGLVLLA